MILFATEVWRATGYSSITENWNQFNHFDFIALTNMYGLMVTALCYTAVLGALQKIWIPLEFFLGMYCLTGPMIQLLSMWQVLSKNGTHIEDRNSTHDSETELTVVELD